MAVTLVSTLAGSTANSLVSLADADSYHENLLSFAAWDALSDDDKKRALISASASLSELAWWGRLYDATTPQALVFPRVFPGQSDGLTIPAAIVAATCEHALSLAVAAAAGQVGQSERAQMRAEGVTSWTLGNRSETLSAAAAGSTEAALAQFSGRVQRLLKGWIRGAFSTDSGRRPRTGSNRDRHGMWWCSELMP